MLASQGLLDLRMGIAVLMGASIGTCLTPILAGLGTYRAGLRVAIVHTLINVVGVSIWVWLIPQLADLSTTISPAHPQLTGVALLAADTPRQLANAYTIFKLANLLLFVGFTKPIAALVERWVADRPEIDQIGARYLDDDVLATPDMALELVRRELVRLCGDVAEMVDDGMPTVLHGGPDDLVALADRDRRIDAVYDDLIAYLRHIGRHELTDQQGDELVRAIAMANDLESIGDVVETNLVQLGQRRLAEGVLPSEPTTEVVTDFHAAVIGQLRQVQSALATDDRSLSRAIVKSKPDLKAQRRAAIAYLADRLNANEPNRIRSYEREVETIGQLQRIAGMTRHLARTIQGAKGGPSAEAGDGVVEEEPA